MIEMNKEKEETMKSTIRREIGLEFKKMLADDSFSVYLKQNKDDILNAPKDYAEKL